MFCVSILLFVIWSIFMNFFYQTYFRNGLSFNTLKFYFFLVICLLLTSCSSESPSHNAAKSSKLALSYPLSSELKTIFDETCAQCHLKVSTGAPKAGDSKAWEKILSKGMDATLERSMNGYGGMPPAGQCFECSPEQLIELIRYMSSEA